MKSITCPFCSRNIKPSIENADRLHEPTKAVYACDCETTVTRILQDYEELEL